MLDLLIELPTQTRCSNNKIYTITNNCDWKTIIKCQCALSEKDINEELKVLSTLTMFYVEITIDNIEQHTEILIELITFMFWVISYSNMDEKKNTSPTMNFKKDIKLVLEGISMQHGEIRNKQLHWWTFLDYVSGIKDSTLNIVTGIRYKKAHNKKLDQYEKEFATKNAKLMQLY